MLTKSFSLRMSVLWALIAAVRILLTWGLTSGGLSPKLVSVLTLLSLPIVLMLECLILVKAAREFRSESAVTRTWWAAPGKIGIRSIQLLIGLLIFALPFGIWDSRLEPDATAPDLVGCAINLLFVSAGVSAVAVYKKRNEQAM